MTNKFMETITFINYFLKGNVEYQRTKILMFITKNWGQCNCLRFACIIGPNDDGHNVVNIHSMKNFALNCQQDRKKWFSVFYC
jgi:hypothetical protein